jgi:hypothetical protein
MFHSINNNMQHATAICSKKLAYVPNIMTLSGLNTLYAKL